ncbi:MAG: energy transducer TonB [Brevinematia bacterium]
MRVGIYITSKKYSPRWTKFYAISVIINVTILLLLFINFSKNPIEFKTKEVKINLVSQNRIQEKDTTFVKPQPKIKNSLSKQEADRLIFEIISPKISPKISESSENILAEPQYKSPKISEYDRDIQENLPNTTKAKTSSSLAKGKVKDEEISDRETLTTPSTLIPPSKQSSTEEITSNIKWIKGGPRKVIEWYQPEIPPNILKKETKILITFHIEPSGFVSRVEIIETSGEPKIDEAILKTMRKIRFNTTSYTTIASVSITIIPK